jgi:cyclopropane fatty-acyl-phospholipid synthase-like methyltransferase
MTDRFSLDARSETIDFGCGPGLYTIRLARKGIGTTGIDFSRRSIEYAESAARNERVDIAYIHADYLRFEPAGTYDLAVMIMCDFCALGPEQRTSMLSKFKRILKPGGSILLDVYSRRYYDSRTEIAAYEFNQMSNFWSAGDYYAFQNTYKYDDEGVILDKYTIIEPRETRVVYNWLQCFTVDSLKAEFRENGLTVEEVYSDVAGSEYREDSPEIAVVARLP